MSEQPLLSYFQLIFSFLFPKITKLLSLIPKISVILALEHISFLLFIYFSRFKLYTRFDVCSYFFAKNLALGEIFFLSPTLNIIQPFFNAKKVAYTKYKPPLKANFYLIFIKKSTICSGILFSPPKTIMSSMFSLLVKSI